MPVKNPTPVIQKFRGPHFIDLAGRQCNDWTVIDYAYSRNHMRYWLCRCKCGNVGYIPTGALIRNKSKACKQCGCRTHGHVLNGKESRAYRSWKKMWNRCTNPNNKYFKDYGGRGITVCERWKDFSAFLNRWESDLLVKLSTVILIMTAPMNLATPDGLQAVNSFSILVERAGLLLTARRLP